MTDKELNELHTRMGGTPTRPTYNKSKVTPVISPPPREWVNLTLEDIPNEYFGNKDFLQGATWARAKLKELNT